MPLASTMHSLRWFLIFSFPCVPWVVLVLPIKNNSERRMGTRNYEIKTELKCMVWWYRNQSSHSTFRLGSVLCICACASSMYAPSVCFFPRCPPESVVSYQSITTFGRTLGTLNWDVEAAPKCNLLCDDVRSIVLDASPPNVNEVFRFDISYLMVVFTVMFCSYFGLTCVVKFAQCLLLQRCTLSDDCSFGFLGCPLESFWSYQSRTIRKDTGNTKMWDNSDVGVLHTSISQRSLGMFLSLCVGGPKRSVVEWRMRRFLNCFGFVLGWFSFIPFWRFK